MERDTHKGKYLLFWWKLYADLEACVNTLKLEATNCVMASRLERQLEYFSQ